MTALLLVSAIVACALYTVRPRTVNADGERTAREWSWSPANILAAVVLVLLALALLGVVGCEATVTPR